MKPEPEARRPRPTRPDGRASATANNELDLFKRGIKSLDDLDRHVVRASTPIVNQIIDNKSQDKGKIEERLFGLLICARIPEGRELFKSLCRYYVQIDYDCTSDYVYAYQALWDSTDHRNLNRNPARPLPINFRHSTSMPADPNPNELMALVASLREAQLQAANRMTPIVTEIINTESRKQREIEQTLDYLLDCACIREGLLLFNTLCRYYLFVDAAATKEYINSYRDMWGERK